MRLKKSDLVICIHGPFEGLGIIYDTNNSNKVEVLFAIDREFFQKWYKEEYFELVSLTLLQLFGEKVTVNK